ncbi:MAG: sodium:calcium antiporter [Haliscomenobacteraceae bacterium CHB4]|nr:sodium:calcium antiporter [Haliscomenobacteraceae bacterium CHB4]
MDFLWLAVGLVLVLYSAKWLVEGASSVAKSLKVPDLVIGLTIVAFGTSAPELVANLFAALDGKTDIAIGNILGSNIANILLILGIAATIYPLKVHHGTTWKEIPLSLLAALVLLIMANDTWLDGNSANVVSRSDGLVLLGFMSIFLVYTFEIAKRSPDDTEDVLLLPTWKSVTFIVAGLLGLFLGGKWFVDGASGMAHQFGISDRVIGLTVVAVGTSLPELATSIIAALKKKADIAVGNVVGSNIFNTFFILGVSGIIQPLSYNAAQLNVDAFMNIGASVLLFLSTRTLSKSVVTRVEGVIFTGIYFTYLLYLIVS